MNKVQQSGALIYAKTKKINELHISSVKMNVDMVELFTN